MPGTICYSRSLAEEFRCALSDTLELQIVLKAPLSCSESSEFPGFPPTLLFCMELHSPHGYSEALISHRGQCVYFKLWRKTQSPFMLKETVARLEVMNVSISPGEMDDSSEFLNLVLGQGQLTKHH